MTYTLKPFSPDNMPRVGQRVRTTVSVTTGGHLFPAGTLADVAGLSVTDVKVTLYGKTHLNTVCTTDAILAVAALEPVRGKPYVPGIDDRRREGTNPTVTGPHPNAMERALAGEADDVADDDELSEALEALRRVASRPKVAPLDLTPVMERLDRIDGNAEVTAGRVNAHGDAIETLNSAVAGTLDALTGLDGRIADATAKIDALADAIATVPRTVLARAAAVTAAMSGTDPLMSAVLRYYTPGAAAGANVLLCSPPSLGKSFAIRRIGALYDMFFEHGCSDDADEIATLLGSPVPDGHGGFVMVDGILPQAVRAAASGQTVLFLFDEVFRLSPRAQEWALTFLTGYIRPDGSKWYRLRTRRALADGTLELIECPASHLHIIGATNLGMIAPIEAFWSRWLKVRVEFTPDIVREVSQAVCDAHGIADSDKLVAAYVTIVTESRAAVASGTLRYPADIRLLVAACATAPDATGASVAGTLAGMLCDQTAHWNLDTGDTLAESRKVADNWMRTLTSLAV